MSKKSQRLTNKQLYELQNVLRQGLDRVTLEKIAPLVWHINWLANRIDELERDLKIVNQPDMFEQSDLRQKVIQRQMQARVESATAERYPLRVRLRILLETGQVGSEAWERELRYFRLTSERAVELAKQAQQQDPQ